MSTPPRPARTRALLAAAVCALASLGVAAPAYAGSAAFDPVTGTVSFDAGAGENNAVTFSDGGGGLVRVTDANQPVTTDPATGCQTDADGVSALCGDGIVTVSLLSANLGDGNDSASTQLGSVPVSFDGGPGDDTLTGGDAADTLTGGDGNDVLDGGGGADTIDGQGDTDTVTYASRTQGVAVSLDGQANDGEPGEGDNVVNVENVTGGSGNDTLTGDGNANVLNGGDGNDLLDGGGGADTLDGGAGEDRVTYASRSASVSVTMDGQANDGEAGEGDNVVNVEDVTGGSGDDTLVGDGAGNILQGGDGNDTLDGGGGADTLDGQGGTDTASYASRSDDVSVSLDGQANDGAPGEGDNVIGVENITGGSGNDTLTGDGGANRILGGPGNDTIDGGFGADYIDGGDGTDRVSYDTRTSPVAVILDGAANDGQLGENDNVVNVENVSGGSGDDTLTGDANANVLDGNGGNDTLSGGGGNDTLNGGAGDDTMTGGDGGDAFNGGPGTDTVSYADHTAAVAVDIDGLTGDDGNSSDGPAGSRDTVALDVENLIGGPGNDVLGGSSAANRIDGGDGGDLIEGGDGNDTILGGNGGDTLGGGAGDDTVDGGAGDDLIDGEGGSDQLIGGTGVDFVSYSSRTGNVTASLGGSSNDGEAGENDSISSDVEALIGGSGNDVLTGDGNANYLDGGPGNDTITGGAGQDTLFGGEGNDTIMARDGAVDQIGCGAGTDSAQTDVTENFVSPADCESIDDGTGGGGSGGSPGGGSTGGSGSTGGTPFPSPGVGGVSSSVSINNLISNILGNAQVSGSPLGALGQLAGITSGSLAAASVNAVAAATTTANAAANANRSATGMSRPHPLSLRAKLSAPRVTSLPGTVTLSGRLSPATKVGTKGCGKGAVQASISLPKGKTYKTRGQLNKTCSFKVVLKLTPKMSPRHDSRVVVRFLGNPYQLPYTLKPALRLLVL